MNFEKDRTWIQKSGGPPQRTLYRAIARPRGGARRLLVLAIIGIVTFTPATQVAQAMYFQPQPPNTGTPATPPVPLGEFPRGGSGTPVNHGAILYYGGFGQFKVSCAAPGFVDCSIAFAIGAGGSYTVPVVNHDITLSMGMAGVGGASSLTLGSGGFGRGVANSEAVECTYGGSSGACIDTSGFIVWYCRIAYAHGLGGVNVAGISTIPGPWVDANAMTPCDSAATSVRTDDAATPEQVEAMIKSDLHAKLDTATAELTQKALSDFPENLRGRLEDAINASARGLHEQVETIEVLPDYSVVLPETESS